MGDTEREIELTSPAFADGAPIPEEYGYQEQNCNPPLSIHGVPEGTQSQVLVIDDPDAREPAGKIWDHWVVWNIDPDRSEIPKDWDTADANAVEGQNDFGEAGYGGPSPPDRRHTYRFVLSALSTTLDLEEGATKAALEQAMNGHVIAQTQLAGTYTP